jgi:hypothetical protein
MPEKTNLAVPIHDIEMFMPLWFLQATAMHT